MSSTEARKGPRRTGNDSPIARARLAAGMTQEQLGAAIGTSKQQIKNWEIGFRRPKIDALIRIADALGCELSELIDLSGGK